MTHTCVVSSCEKLKWDNPPSYHKWKREVDDVRAAGFALDHGHYINGVAILAVPFLDDRERMTHSIVAIDIAKRFDAIGVASIADEMVRIRDAVSQVRRCNGAASPYGR